MRYILALDQGTTSTRAIVFDKNRKIVGKAQQEFEQLYPRAGWVEHAPRDIFGTAMGVIAEALVRADADIGDIAAIGITNQRETTLVWDRRTGTPVYNAIVWQCRRTQGYAERLKRDGLAPYIYEKTGLVPDAYFSATKISWILDNVKDARERAERGDLLFGTVDTYLMWRLSKGRIFATDYTNASRTMLFNIHTLQWDEDLVRLFKIPLSMLPAVQPSGSLFGETDKGVLGAEVPICGVAGDQQAALFGHLCTEEGDVKNTYGTGCFLLMNTGEKAVRSTNGLVTTLGASLDGRPPYVLEGSVFVAGAAVQWLRDELGLVSSAAETEMWADKVGDTAGVYIVPAFTGLGAPYWDSSARGLMCGITRGANKAHIIRAVLESIAYQTEDLIAAMRRASGLDVIQLRVDGGASQNNFLMKFQADVSGIEILRPEIVETTALGAAYLAGLTCGYWTREELEALVSDAARFTPSMDEKTRRNLMDGWARAVSRARMG